MLCEDAVLGRKLTKPRSDECALGRRKTAHDVPDEEPHIGGVQHDPSSVHFRQRADDKRPDSSGQEVDGQGHGGLGGVHVKVGGD